MEELAGRQFGPYRIVESIGEGGMAAVYKAYQPAVDRYVALKVLPRIYATDAQFVARFRHEARIVAQLQHPHIVPIFDFGEYEGYSVLAMPFIPGGTLADICNGKPLEVRRVQSIVSNICSALAYAHRKGVVHRDLKPRNILLDEGENCLVADFGIARLAERMTQLTMTGSLLGTPEYMSPEQAGGEPAVQQSDIYSLGIILYELLTGRVPFKAETPMAVAVKHLTASIPSPRLFNPRLSMQLEEVLLRALARSPAERFQTANDMSEAVREAIESIVTASAQQTLVRPPRRSDVFNGVPKPDDATSATGAAHLREDLSERIALPANAPVRPAVFADTEQARPASVAVGSPAEPSEILPVSAERGSGAATSKAAHDYRAETVGEVRKRAALPNLFSKSAIHNVWKNPSRNSIKLWQAFVAKDAFYVAGALRNAVATPPRRAAVSGVLTASAIAVFASTMKSGHGLLTTIAFISMIVVGSGITTVCIVDTLFRSRWAYRSGSALGGALLGLVVMDYIVNIPPSDQRGVSRIPCDFDDVSERESSITTRVKFFNSGNEPIKIGWRDSRGEWNGIPELLAPGGTKEMETFAGQLWEIRNRDDRCLIKYLIRSELPSIVVTS